MKTIETRKRKKLVTADGSVSKPNALSSFRKKSRKKSTSDHGRTWYLNLAFALGKSAHKVSRKMDSAATAVEKNLDKTRQSFVHALKRKKARDARVKIGRVKVLSESQTDSTNPAFKEMKVIADISGLTAALREMDEIGRRHSKHPAVTQLLAKLKKIPPAEQERLSEKLIARLNASPYFNQMMSAMPGQFQMQDDDCRKISETFIECLSETLGDAGIARAEIDAFSKLGDEMMRPLNDLMELYLKPKTFSQKVKRLWRLQRIFMKMIKLVHRANALASAAGQSNAKRGNISEIKSADGKKAIIQSALFEP